MTQRILIVDDDPHVLRGLRRMLRGHNGAWEITFVSNADAALERLGSAAYDAVLLDVMMPGRNGFDVLATLSGMSGGYSIPVVMVTGAHQSDLKRRALELGAVDLLTKPVEPEDLLARLRNVLRIKAYQEEIKAQNADLERRVAERTKELADSRLEVIWRLGKAAEYRDEETGNHVVRVAYYCRTLAEALGLPADFVETLFLTSPLHDLGKIGIPDAILLKPGRLTPEEWDVMKEHCVIGAEILGRNSGGFGSLIAGRAVDGDGRRAEDPLLKMASSIALTHHEWWDGTGYPQGLAGDRIPIEGRIVALADVYDALTSARPYKPALTEATVLAIMRDEAGRHFDPSVYAAFERSIEAFRAIGARFGDHGRA